MKTLVSILLLASLLIFSGCAKQQAQYQESIIKVNELAIASVDAQVKSNAERRQQSMVFFSQAMVEASKTDDPTDNAVIAFAWGFQTGTPDDIEMPQVRYPEKPADGVDYMRAGVPYFNVIWPWLWGAYGSGGSDGGQRITADNGGTVILDSGNAGSYNQASKGATLDASGSVVNDSSTNLHAGRDNNYGGVAGGDFSGSEGECPAGYTLRLSTGTCITLECEAQIDAGGSDSCDGGIVGGQGTDPVAGMTLAECLANPPGGFKGSTPMYTATNSCRSSGLPLE